MKVSPSIETSFVSREEDLFLREQRKRRNEYWVRICIAKEYYTKIHGVPSPKILFWEWLKKEYGVVPKFVFDNNSEEYEIIDEKLYLLFLLKFNH